MEIKLDDSAMRDIVSSAVLRQLDDKAREALIKGAIEHLLTKPASNGYGRAVSPLTEAFQNAVVGVAKQVVNDIVASDPNVERMVRKCVVEGLKKIEERGYNTLSDKTADAITRAIFGEP